MRTDQQLPDKAFRQANAWQTDPVAGQTDPGMDQRYHRGRVEQQGQFRWHSFSGQERNHLFLNEQGRAFHDVSALSGLDNIADGRASAIGDFDRDGWLDVALVSANQPLLNLYHNRMAQLDHAHPAQFLAIRLVGGNTAAEASDTFSSRDAFGAQLRITAGEQVLLREYRCGEGLAAQNSSTLVVGIGPHSAVDALQITWPSGRQTTTAQVPAGSLVTAFENAAASPQGNHFVIGPYQRIPLQPASDRPSGERLTMAPRLVPQNTARWQLFTTMATWCSACQSHLPQLDRLRQHFAPEQIALYGVPIDSIETVDQLRQYVDRYRPAYQLIEEVADRDREELQTLIRRWLHSEALPATLLVDEQGKVVEAFPGVPTVSQIAKAMAESTEN